MEFKSDQIKPSTRCQRLINHHRCNLEVWALAQSRGDGHCSLVTPKNVVSEYNKDLIFDLNQLLSILQ